MTVRTSAAYMLVMIAMVSKVDASALSEFSWRNRVLVVVAQAGNDEHAIQQRQIFERASRGMSDRDVVLVEAIGDRNVPGRFDPNYRQAAKASKCFWSARTATRRCHRTNL